MKIIYYHNPKGKFYSDDTEGHIIFSLQKLGHEVKSIYEGFIAPTLEADILLFHKSAMSPDELKNAFRDLRVKRKICWYFDKVWGVRVEWINKILPMVDKLFITDETWTKEHPDPKYHILRQGVGEEQKEGINIPIEGQIVFAGSIYGERSNFVKSLQKRYGNNFKLITEKASLFNQDFSNLAVSTPIMVAPHYPSDDYYWSSRVYITIGSGGFLIHPRFKGLEKEYKDKREIVYYDNEEDMFQKIDYYLEHREEREAIRKTGYEKTRAKYTYTHRVAELLKNL